MALSQSPQKRFNTGFNFLFGNLYQPSALLCISVLCSQKRVALFVFESFQPSFPTHSS